MLNRIILQGRLVRDIEVKEVGGFKMAEFTVAWSEKYKDNETKCFLRCKAWRTTAEFLSKFFVKGQELIIEGKMVTEEWEKDGQKQSRSICTVEKVDFCGTKNSSASTPDPTPAPVPTDKDGFMNIPDGLEEELPFT